MEEEIRTAVEHLLDHLQQALHMQRRLAAGDADKRSLVGQQAGLGEVFKPVVVRFLGRLRAHHAKLIALLRH